MKTLLLALQPNDSTNVAETNTGTVIGIVLFAIVLLAVVIYFIWKNKRNEPTTPPPHDTTHPRT
jgi:Mg/Co/Ni transporter MgtE